MPVKRFIPLAALAVFCAAMALIVCNPDDKCAADPTATPGCPGYVDTTTPPPGENDIHTLTLTAGTGGTVAPSPKKTRYAQGESVTITASPNPDYDFAGWSGDASGTANPLTVTMTGDKSVTAAFKPKNLPPPGENDIHTLTLTAGTGGRVSKDPDKVKYAQGESVTITATASAGYEFAGWTGDATGTSSPQIIIMTGNKSITASFRQKSTGGNDTYTITLTAGIGGAASKVPNTETHPLNEQVTITASPDENYRFSGWGGDTSGTTNPLTVKITKNRAILANFTYVEPPPPPGIGGDGPFSLTVNINPPEGGSAVPAPEVGEGPVWGPYEAGTRVTISYAENPGYQFDGWTGDGSGNFNRSVTMAANRTVTANFEQMSGPPPGGQTYTLNLDITTIAAKNSGKCAVTQPKGTLGLYTYNAGESITVNATSSAPYVFQGWREKNATDDVSSNAGYTFTINKNTDLIARFIDTTTPDAVKYCRWEGSSSNCWKIDPYSTDPNVTKSEAECLAKDGEVVEDCSAAANGVYCSYPATKDDPASCAWRPGASAAAAGTACRGDGGTVVDSCP